jgi:uncharacterized protein YwbE
MGKVFCDLECRNPGCENPTRLNDVRAGRAPDGTIFVEKARGVDIEAVCSSCHGKLSRALSPIHIGRSTEHPHGERPPSCDGCRCDGRREAVEFLKEGGTFRNLRPILTKDDDTGNCHRGVIADAIDSGGEHVANLVLIRKEPCDDSEN